MTKEAKSTPSTHALQTENNINHASKQRGQKSHTISIKQCTTAYAITYAVRKHSVNALVMRFYIFSSFAVLNYNLTVSSINQLDRYVR